MGDRFGSHNRALLGVGNFYSLEVGARMQECVVPRERQRGFREADKPP